MGVKRKGNPFFRAQKVDVKMTVYKRRDKGSGAEQRKKNATKKKKKKARKKRKNKRK